MIDTQLLLSRVCQAAAVVVAACILGALIQLIRSKTRMDVILCVDMTTYLTVALIALLVLVTGHAAFLDAAITLALIAFVATVALARYAEAEERK